MSERTILKLYSNGDLEVFVPIKTLIENLFDKNNSTNGSLSPNDGSVVVDLYYGAKYSHYIPVEPNESYAIRVIWDLSKATWGGTVWTVAGGFYYDKDFNFIGMAFYHDRYDTDYQNLLTPPSNVAYIRLSSSYLDTPITNIEFFKGNRAPNANEVVGKGFIINEDYIATPSLIKYSTTMPMPEWVRDTGNPISIFKEGIVIKGNLIDSSM